MKSNDTYMTQMKMEKSQGNIELRSKKTYLDWLYYKMNRQLNYNLAYAYIDNNGNPRWSRHWAYLHVQAWPELIRKVNNRQILYNELVLDFDLQKDETKAELAQRYRETLRDLNAEGYVYRAFETGSRGWHIHLYFNELFFWERPRREEFREFLIKKFKCDTMKRSDKGMIALEHASHWKTGKVKKLIAENG